MAVLVPDLACRLDSLRPRHDQRVRGATLVVRVALVHLERRREGYGPTGGVVVVRLGRTQDVEVLEAVLDRVDDAVEELHLVDGAVWTAFAARSVVADDDDDRVVELARLLEV